MENETTASCLKPSEFQKVIDGKETWLCALKNNSGAEVTVLNYGAKIVSVVVPDKDGKMTDVVTGHDSIDDYLRSEEAYFGAVCGRYANRIAKGRFTLDGAAYELPVNNGPNSLHGGIKGFNSVVWDMKQIDPQTVELTYTAADGEEGYPGKLDVKVTYKFTDDNELVVTYQAVTDKPTVLNLTNHSYFNLSGAGDPTIADHLLAINADCYLPTDESSIPLPGVPAPVEGTPMDFRTPTAIGARIDADFEALKIGWGYDHCYVLKNDGELALCAHSVSPKTGITMDVFTDQPGVQLYTGNWMTGNLRGKHGQRYPRQAAFCLETQHYPDSPNRPDYPTTVLRPGEKFYSQTVFAFGISQ